MAKHTFGRGQRHTGAVVPGSGGCSGPPVDVVNPPPECGVAGRTEMRTLLGIRALCVNGVPNPIAITVLQRFRIENIKVDSTNGYRFLIQAVMLGNTPALPSTTMGIRAQLLSEVSTDMCLRWPDIRPDLPGTMTVLNDSGADAYFEGVFIGWMFPNG